MLGKLVNWLVSILAFPGRIYLRHKKIYLQSLQENYCQENKEHVFFEKITSNNAKLETMLLLNPSVEFPKKILVMLWGNCDAFQSNFQLINKVKHILPVVTFNYRGFAGSTGRIFSLQDIYDDINTVLEYVKTKLEYEEVIFYGHSMGGALASMYAHQLKIPTKIFVDRSFICFPKMSSAYIIHDYRKSTVVIFSLIILSMVLFNQFVKLPFVYGITISIVATLLFTYISKRYINFYIKFFTRISKIFLKYSGFNNFYPKTNYQKIPVNKRCSIFLSDPKTGICDEIIPTELSQFEKDIIQSQVTVVGDAINYHCTPLDNLEFINDKTNALSRLIDLIKR